jgi:hypothetical protein
LNPGPEYHKATADRQYILEESVCDFHKHVARNTTAC